MNVDGRDASLKPMNCPSHMLMYKMRTRSYRDLPLRIADFAMLHRNELRGALGGLTRVRKFSMDDCHIFVAEEQLEAEVIRCIEFTKYVYELFGFTFDVVLSTRPEKSMGTEKQWKTAEAALAAALKKLKISYTINEGDGAFYGPKIDVNVSDSLGREWTLATIQLDFQMPQRFNLSYIDEKGEKKKPVMIHRSSIGSFERFIGLLLEHFSGNLPLWLAPVQVQVLPIGKKHLKYAKKVFGVLSENGVRAELRDENESVGKKIREGEIRKIPYLLVVGDKEMKSKSVAVRKREKGDTGSVKLEKFAKQIAAEIEKKK